MISFFSKNKLLHCLVVPALVFVLLAPSAALLVLPREATASVPIHCSILDFNCDKEGFFDLLLRIVTSALIQFLTQQIIGWIQGGGGDFVQDFEGFLRGQVDQRGGEFLNQIAGLNLCGNLGSFLNRGLRRSAGSGSRLSQKLTCTVTAIVANVQAYFQNFQNGGWPAFISYNLSPQNDPYAAYLIAFEEKILSEAARADAINQQYLTGQGFLGVQAQNQTCEYDSYTGAPIGCTTQSRVQTPGSLVTDELRKAVGSNFDFIVNSDELSEAIVAIANALVTRLTTAVFP